jgi:hypothetical protein
VRPVAAAPARWNFSFGGKWRLSILFEREEGKGDTTRLLLDAPAGRFVFLSQQDPSGRDSTESIRVLSSGEIFSRRLILSSFEEIPSCSSIRRPDACVIFTSARGQVSSPLSAFAGASGSELRGQAAALVSPATRDALFSLAPLLPSVAEFGSYAKDFLSLVWPKPFKGEQSLKRGTRKPGCEFDAAFGFPCSPEEKAREAKRFEGEPRSR